MTSDEQLKKWVDGESVHNGPTSKDGECCPDFSCCQPGLKWPPEKRKEFAGADDQTRSKMLMGALRHMLDYNEMRRVKIVGEER